MECAIWAIFVQEKFGKRLDTFVCNVIVLIGESFNEHQEDTANINGIKVTWWRTFMGTLQPAFCFDNFLAYQDSAYNKVSLFAILDV